MPRARSRPARIVLGIGLYGYDWSRGHGTRFPGCAPSSCPSIITPGRTMTTPPNRPGSRHRRRRPQARGVVRERGQHAGEVRCRAGIAEQAACSCGCSVMRTPGPGPPCATPCRCQHSRWPSGRCRAVRAWAESARVAGDHAMIPWWGLSVLILGANFALWGSVGICRKSGTLLRRWRPRREPASTRPASTGPAGTGLAGLARPPGGMIAMREDGAHPPALRSLTVKDVAVLIPAHNEALVIGDSLRAITGPGATPERACGLGRVNR